MKTMIETWDEHETIKGPRGLSVPALPDDWDYDGSVTRVMHRTKPLDIRFHEWRPDVETRPSAGPRAKYWHAYECAVRCHTTSSESSPIGMFKTLPEAIEACEDWWRVAVEWKRLDFRVSLHDAREMLEAEADEEASP